MPPSGEMIALFRRQLELSKFGAGQTLGILSEDAIRADYAMAFLAAAEQLGGSAFNVNIHKQPGSAFGARNSLRGNLTAIEALKRVDMVIDLIGLLWSKEQTEITAAGPRMLLVLEPFDVLARMFPSAENRRRAEAAQAMLGRARELRVTSPFGTDVTYRLGRYHVVAQYGYTDAPGRWDAWPGTFIYTAAYEDGVDGRVVIGPGDIILPFKRYVTAPIELTIEAGMVTAIEGGGLEGEVLRAFIDRFDDPRSYAVSHIGWGLDPNARWEFLATSPLAGISGGQDGRSFEGNVLFSTGPNTELGGTNDTLCHLDIPLRGCSLSLDGQPVVRQGRVLAEELVA